MGKRKYERITVRNERENTFLLSNVNRDIRLDESNIEEGINRDISLNEDNVEECTNNDFNFEQSTKYNGGDECFDIESISIDGEDEIDDDYEIYEDLSSNSSYSVNDGDDDYEIYDDVSRNNSDNDEIEFSYEGRVLDIYR